MQRPQTGKRMNWTAAAAAGNRDHRHLAAATRQRPLPSHHSPVLVVRLHRAHDSVASHKATRRVRPRHASSYLVPRTHYGRHLRIRCRCGSYTDDGEHVRFRLNPAALVICCMYASRIGIVTSSTLYIVLELIGASTVSSHHASPAPATSCSMTCLHLHGPGTIDLDHQQQQTSATRVPLGRARWPWRTTGQGEQFPK